MWQPDYATENEFKSYVRLDVSDVLDDAEIALAIAAASRSVDHCTRRQFGLVDAPETRTYPVRYDYLRSVYVVDIDDIQTTSLVVTDDGEDVTADVTLEPVNALLVGRPYTRFSVATVTATSVAVSGMWGWTSVPDTIVQATLLQANRFLKRRGAPFGVAGTPDQGSELRLLAKLDPDVALMLSAYKRLPAVA